MSDFCYCWFPYLNQWFCDSFLHYQESASISNFTFSHFMILLMVCKFILHDVTQVHYDFIPLQCDFVLFIWLQSVKTAILLCNSVWNCSADPTVLWHLTDPSADILFLLFKVPVCPMVFLTWIATLSISFHVWHLFLVPLHRPSFSISVWPHTCMWTLFPSTTL